MMIMLTTVGLLMIMIGVGALLLLLIGDTSQTESFSVIVFKAVRLTAFTAVVGLGFIMIPIGV